MGRQQHCGSSRDHHPHVWGENSELDCPGQGFTSPPRQKPKFKDRAPKKAGEGPDRKGKKKGK